MIRLLKTAFRPDKILALGLLAAVALMMAMATGPVAAQQVLEDIHKTGKKMPYADLPPQYRDYLRSQDMARQKPSGKLVDVEAFPWNTPTGERLVGVVENRMLTKPQLMLRVNLLLRGMPPIDNPLKSQDRRVLLESRILADWKESTTLAVHAKNEGYTVTEQEIDQTLNDLATQSDGAQSESQEVMRMIGIPEDQLRIEIHDGILIEKMVHERMPKYFSERTMRELFATDRSVFLEPTKVMAWQIFYTQRGRLTPRQKSELQKKLKSYGKKLKKCKDAEDYQELAEEMKSLKFFSLSDMGWVYEDERLEKEVRWALFTMQPGKTSDIIRTPLGFHVVKITDRVQGDQGTFNEARPAIESYLFEKTKILIYETVKTRYNIHSNAGGLNIWKKVPKGPRRRSNAPKTANPKVGPSASDLGGDLGDIPPLLPGSATDVPTVESVIGNK